MQGNILLIGTSKGLVIFKNTNGKWAIDTVHFIGMPVSYVFVDERNGAWWIILAHRHWGQKLQYSYDQGETWEVVEPPQYPTDALLSNGQAATLKKIWSIAHAGADRPAGLWLGTEPGGLFYSEDNGQHFELVKGLWNHPSRSDQNQWFGAGRDHPFIHSIVVDPRDSNHLYIAVSCAGVFETMDGGENWEARNKGLIAAYLPNPNVDIGHDPHLLLACPSNPDVLWQQNHCGIFRSEDGGKNWNNVTDKKGLANYGFAIAVDEKDSLKAWVIPAESDYVRVAADMALSVCNTKDGGKSWRAQREGLPQKHCFDIVFRHSMDKYKNKIAFGTTIGNLYLSENKGESWQCLSHTLARIECLVFC